MVHSIRKVVTLVNFSTIKKNLNINYADLATIKAF